MLLRTLLALSGLAIVFALWHCTLPSLGPVTYQYDGNDVQSGILPLSVPSGGKELRIHATVDLATVHPLLFSVVPDDCLESLAVNGATVPFQGPMCFDHRGGTIWLGGKVHPGTNTMEVHIKDRGGLGGLRFGVSLADPILLVSLALSVAIGLMYARSLVTLFGNRRIAQFILLIVVVGFAARLPFAFSTGYPFDLNVITHWAKSAYEFGVAPSYTQQVDGNMLPNYPPFSMLVFAATGRAYRWLLNPQYDIGLPDCLFFMKLPAIMADVLTAVLLFFVVRRLRGGDLKSGVVAGVLYALHPAVVYDSAIWGQVDSLFTLFVLATLAAMLAKRWTLVGSFAALAVLTKMQALFVLPTVGVVCLLERGALRRAALGAAATICLVFLPFLSLPALGAIKDVYLRSAGFFPVLSKHGYNAWVAVFGAGEMGRADDRLFLGLLSYRSLGLTLFGSCAVVLPLVCWGRFRRALRDPSEAAVLFIVPALTVYAFFLFNTEMHERYLFPLMPLGLPLLFTSRRGAYAYVASSVLFLLNLLGVLPWTDVDRALFREFPNLPAFIGACHLFVFGHMVTCLPHGQPPRAAAYLPLREHLALSIRRSP